MVFVIGRIVTQRLVHARGENERAALGAEVTLEREIDRRRDSSQRRRAMQERDIVRPRFDRDLDTCQPSDMLCPRPSRVDNDRRVEVALIRADASDFPSRRADGGDFVMTRVRGERIENREQQRQRKHHHQEAGRGHQVIFGDVAGVESAFLKIAERHEQVGGNPKNQEAAKAEAKRDKQFAQQITVEQTHSVAEA